MYVRLITLSYIGELTANIVETTTHNILISVAIYSLIATFAGFLGESILAYYFETLHIEAYAGILFAYAISLIFEAFRILNFGDFERRKYFENITYIGEKTPLKDFVHYWIYLFVIIIISIIDAFLHHWIFSTYPMYIYFTYLGVTALIEFILQFSISWYITDFKQIIKEIEPEILKKLSVKEKKKASEEKIEIYKMDYILSLFTDSMKMPLSKIVMVLAYILQFYFIFLSDRIAIAFGVLGYVVIYAIGALLFKLVHWYGIPWIYSLQKKKKKNLSDVELKEGLKPEDSSKTPVSEED